MFVLSLNNKRLRGICLAVAAALCVAAFIIINNSSIKKTAACEQTGEYSLSAKDKNQHNEFLMQFGCSILGDAVLKQEIVVPSEFNEIYKKYNLIQVSQGLDLTPYMGKKVIEYVYEITKNDEHSTDGPENRMFASLIVYKGVVIGGHIENALKDSQMLPFYGV